MAVRTAETRAETVPIAEISGRMKMFPFTPPINQMSLKFCIINKLTNIFARFSQGHCQNGSREPTPEGANVYGRSHHYRQFAGL